MDAKVCGCCGAEFVPATRWQKWCSKICSTLVYRDRKRGGPATRQIILGAIEHRLLARREIDPATGCWNWTGSTCNGYGQLAVDGRMFRVHRLSAEAFITQRPIPSDVFVCHRCDNPKCFNPDRLFLGSTDDNMKDAAAKGRTVFGVRHHKSKITPSDVRKIREAAQEGVSPRFLAVALGVRPSTIRDAINGKTWKRVA